MSRPMTKQEWISAVEQLWDSAQKEALAQDEQETTNCRHCGGAKDVICAGQCKVQPEQEPVAFYVYKPTLPRGHLGNVSDGDLPWVYDQDPSSGYSARMLVYTAPPKREWVSLTDGEMHECAGEYPWTPTGLKCCRAIEAKLKEKNS